VKTKTLGITRGSSPESFFSIGREAEYISLFSARYSLSVRKEKSILSETLSFIFFSLEKS